MLLRIVFCYKGSFPTIMAVKYIKSHYVPEKQSYKTVLDKDFSSSTRQSKGNSSESFG